MEPLRGLRRESASGSATSKELAAYYDRKRAEGKNHKQAVLSLARRRANVPWAMIRDGSCYLPSHRVIAST